MTRTIEARGQKFVVIYRGAVERQFQSRSEAEAYLRAGRFPSVFRRT